jgi:transcriptional regulator with XRE-family HTH domain
MKQSARKLDASAAKPVRVLGRGLHARRGVRLTARAIREATGKTQVDVARAAQMDQADVSRLERRAEFDDCQVATLRRYIEALGGKLELVAAFNDKQIILAGAEQIAEVEPGKAG